jgi:hypothetical protein
MVSAELGRVDPDHVAPVHVTWRFSFPSGDPAEFASLPPVPFGPPRQAHDE